MRVSKQQGAAAGKSQSSSTRDHVRARTQTATQPARTRGAPVPLCPLTQRAHVASSSWPPPIPPLLRGAAVIDAHDHKGRQLAVVDEARRRLRRVPGVPAQRKLVVKQVLAVVQVDDREGLARGVGARVACAGEKCS